MIGLLSDKVNEPDDQVLRSKIYFIAWKCSLGVLQQYDGP